MGSYGSKWKHGWIPLNPVATALKLKQLRAGGGHQRISHGGHSITIASTHRGNFGAVVEHPDGTSHYLEHDSRARLGRMARSHVATLRAQQVAQDRHVRAHNASVAKEEQRARKEERARQAHSDWVYQQEQRNRANANTPSGSEGRKVRATRGSMGERIGNPAGPSSVTTAGLPNNRYSITSDSMGLTLKHNGKMIRTSSDRDALVKYAQEHFASTKGPEFSKQEVMLPGVREHNGEKIIIKPSVKMHNAGHRFPEAGIFSPQVEHDQFGVEHSNGAHLGYIDTNGGLHIGGPRLPRHKVSNVKEAIAGLHANYAIYERDRAEAKAKAEAEKASTKTYREEQMARGNLVAQVAANEFGKSTYAERNRIEREALMSGATHEEHMAFLNRKLKEKRVANIASAQRERSRLDTARKRHFAPEPKRRPVTKDSEIMAKARAEMDRRLSNSLDLSSAKGEEVDSRAREGLSVTHGGRAGHVIARYGSTFDTYHPPTEGQNGFYMRHYIRTRRGRKEIVSTFAGHSNAKAS